MLLVSNLRKSGKKEVGGILLAEHTGENEFTLREITVHKQGSLAYFVRHIHDALTTLRSFFRHTHNDYKRFNYLGEWHSHPSFQPIPSRKDDFSMFEIVGDSSVGANFAVLLVVKLADDGRLIGTAHTYLPNGTKHLSSIVWP